MRLPPFIVTQIEEVLREVLRFTGPADVILSHFFRDHRQIGGRDRGVIAEAVYAFLRNKSVLMNFAESGVGPMMHRLALLALTEIVEVASIAGLNEQEVAWLEHTSKIDRSQLPLAMRVNLPEWLFDYLMKQYGEVETVAFADAMNQRAPLDLRVNSLKADRDSVMKVLSEENIVCEITPYSALGIRVPKKPALQNMPIFKDGLVEVQDEGSQLLAQLLGAKRGNMVVDFCAGAGGKTLAIGAAMRNTGRLYAFDVSERRLSKLKPRLARSGLSNVHPVLIAHEHDAKVKRLAGKIDRVLVDAPCSGLGTLRRNPDMKWRQTAETIVEMNEKQTAILASASRLVKQGGRLVYGTCSFMPEENERIVEAFLASHPDFVLVPMKQVLAEQKIDLDMTDYLKLLPQHHETDGFFAAVLERQLPQS